MMLDSYALVKIVGIDLSGTVGITTATTTINLVTAGLELSPLVVANAPAGIVFM